MDRESIEASIRQALQQQDWASAATLTIESYGPEVLGFVEDRIGNGGDAQDVFAEFLETLWGSLSTYRGDCSMRTWCYMLARRGIAHYRRALGPRRRFEPLSEIEPLSRFGQLARSHTAPFQRTEIKNRARQLRETLDDEDQQLLILRLERGLEFREIARVFAEGSELDEASLKRESARLRKRFQLAKDKLAELLIKDGLVQKD